MKRLGRIVRDYAESGAVNSLIALWAFVDDTTFLTKAGHVGVVYRLRGHDAEGMTHAQRRDVVHRVEAALRLLDERCRVYQYVIKDYVSEFEAPPCSRPVAQEALARRAAYLNGRRQDLFTLNHFLVLVYEAPGTTPSMGGLWRSPRQVLRTWLSRSAASAVLETELVRAIATLHQKARALEVQLAEAELRRLIKAEAFQFFRRLLNVDSTVAADVPLLYDTHLDYFVADSTIECHREHLTIGHGFVKVATMKEPPAQTYAHICGDLLALPGSLIACLEWQRMPADRVRRDIQNRRRHYFNKRVSIVNYVSRETRPEEMLVDDSAGAIVQQLGDAMTEAEVHGHFFGLASLTLVFSGPELPELEISVGRAVKALAAHDGHLVEETYNRLNAWAGTIPGNGAFNLRRMALLETNLADLSFLFRADTGDPVSSQLGRPAVAVFETAGESPYWYNLHVADVGHTLVLGATGSGKSFVLNFLITHLQQYEPFTVVLDLGHSYRKLAGVLDGGYLELSPRQQIVMLNPFDVAVSSPEGLHFLHAFTKVLVEGDDGYRMSEAEDRETYEAVENLFVLEREQRRLLTLSHLLPRALGRRLHKWVEGGRYGSMFDNVRDTLVMDRLQVFDFASMREYPSLLEPLLFYMLHRVGERIHATAEVGCLKLCIIDEAWRLIQHPTLRAYVQESLKTWRKHNAAVLLATQTIDDFASVDLLRTVVESCPTRLLLANPSMDRQQYADLFQLNEMELSLLSRLTPRGELLLKRPGLAKVLSLRVDPKSYWIYTNTPPDNARVTDASREHGLAAGIDRLAESA